MAFALAALIFAAVAQDDAPVRFTPQDTLDALTTASARTGCVVRYEVGGVGWNPYAIGRAGEQGAAQLHPQGRLGDFYRKGYTDPFDPYQAVAYLDGELAAGRGGAWSPISRGLC